MDYEIVIPPTADGALEVTVNRWMAEAGQQVKKGKDLVEAITEKVALYVPAPADGVLAEIRVPEGTKVPVGEVVGIVRGE